ncbi:MAG: UvrD-helicase domain-containing protein, partial [Acidobacteriota bacterium]
ERPLVVEAGAGTGKTATLTARALAWCVGPGWERQRGDAAARASALLSGLAAWTFTEAAAAEMRRRFRDGLVILADAEPPPPGLPVDLLDGATSERARALLDAGDALDVRTFHAACFQLLSDSWGERGAAPALRVDADGRAARGAASQVLARTLRDAGSPGAAALPLLLDAGLTAGRVAEELAALVGEGVLPEELAGGDPTKARELSRLRLVEAATALRRQLPGGLDGAPSRSTGARALVRGLQLLARAQPVDDDEWKGLLASWFPEAARTKLGRWEKGDLAASEKKWLRASRPARLTEACGALRAELETWEQLRPEELTQLRSGLAALLTSVREELGVAGWLGFGDLLRQTRDWLRRDDVAERLRSRRRQLLVDEVQDTDPLQAEIVTRLALTGAPEQRPGLFLVGDPKQSIYGWRDAELSAYEGLVGAVEEAGGERLHLHLNFRSCPAVLTEVEAVLAPALQAEEGVQAGWEGLVAARDDDPGFTAAERTPVELWDHGEPSRPRSQSLEREAEAVAVELSWLHREEGVPWSDFGLLLRRFNDLTPVLRALRQHGIPHRQSSTRKGGAHRIVSELAALLRCVLDPADRLALVAYLRSSLVTLPDAFLWPLHEGGGLERCAELRSERDDDSQQAELQELVATLRPPDDAPGFELVNDARRSLAAALRVLGRARRLYLEASPTEWLLSLRDDVFGPGTWSGLSPRGREAADGWLAGVHRRLVAEDFELGSFLRRLEREPESFLPTARIVPEDVVTVSTWHAAKGLDFEQVFVLQLHAGTQPPRSAVEWHRHGEDLELSLGGFISPGLAVARR